MVDTGIVCDVEKDFLEFLRAQQGDFDVQIKRQGGHFYIGARIQELPEIVEGDGPSFAIAWSEASSILL